METHKLQHSTSQKLLGPIFLLFYILVYGSIGWVSQNDFLRIATILLAIGTIYAYSQMFGFIEFSKNNIKVKNSFKELKIFRWSDIAGVNRSSRLLHLSDRQGNRLFSVDKNLVGAKHFINYLSQQAPNIFYLPIGEELKPNYIGLMVSILFVIGIGGLIAWLSFDINISLGIIIAFATFVLAVFELRRSTLQITLERDRLILTSMRATNEFLVSEIETIDLITKKRKSQNIYHLTVNFYNGENVKLITYGYYPVILYLQLKSWFDKAKEPHSAH